MVIVKKKTVKHFLIFPSSHTLFIETPAIFLLGIRYFYLKTILNIKFKLMTSIQDYYLVNIFES